MVAKPADLKLEHTEAYQLHSLTAGKTAKRIRVVFDEQLRCKETDKQNNKPAYPHGATWDHIFPNETQLESILFPSNAYGRLAE